MRNNHHNAETMSRPAKNGTGAGDPHAGSAPPRRPASMPTQVIVTCGPLRMLVALACALAACTRQRPRARPWPAPGQSGGTGTAGLSVRRWLFIGFVMAATALATARLWAVLRVEGLTPLEYLLLAIFAVLFAWIASSFWIACTGIYTIWRGGARMPPAEAPGGAAPAGPSPSRTAIVMPIYNEDPVQVFAGLRATLESVARENALEGFDFYVLSDSTDPDCWASEEAEWRRLRDAEAPRARIFYRRRARNIGRKSGNIADFCESWGALYDYMVVLDADSLMTGETLVSLVRRMDDNPRVALIQTPPALVGGISLFARIQQFAGSVYGPVYSAGLAWLQGGDGNYWGHNAIIRVQPFMHHCGLPRLPGRPPLGGEIMSHDFVEAALLRRAGWEVWLAPELGGSYEAAPPTLLNYLKRDRRWCQGNLQHIKLIFAQGLRMPSRLHFFAGVMSYLSSPLWLLLLVLFAVEVVRVDQISVTYVGRYPVLAWPISHAVEMITLVLATATLLFGPKVLAFVTLLRDPAAVRTHGGVCRLALGVALESVFSTLLAPVMMLSHSWFVASVLIGRGTGWGGQQRGAYGVALGAAARAFAPHTAIAVVVGTAAWHFSPGVFWWYVPLLSGLALAIVLCRATSIPAWGAAAGRWGLFLIPSEATGLPILHRVEEILIARDAIDEDGPRLVRYRGASAQPVYPAPAAERAT